MLITEYDFETEAIESRPVYPPKPVGFAIHEEGVVSRYYAWGHPTENNTTFEAARAVLKTILTSRTCGSSSTMRRLTVQSSWRRWN